MAKPGFFGRLRDGLSKTRDNMLGSVRRTFTGAERVTDETFETLEETLIAADLGVETTLAIVEAMRTQARQGRISGAEGLYEALKRELAERLSPGDHSLQWDSAEKPHVTLVAGVNGSGKTTTIGKMAAKLTGEGRQVILGAADTFRAAAIEQLTIWSERAGADIVKHASGSDPAAVAYDAADAAAARQADHLIIDTAGRLHTKVNLMEELKKTQRVIQKRIPSAPHEVLLVIDATTGQNGLQQARIFTEALNVTGVVLTKLDGTAKGGIIVAIQEQLGIPIKLIGVGEGIDDLQPFEPEQFVEALFAE
jgi:fused signal recognition particle receptor